jgi:hypothetical protein
MARSHRLSRARVRMQQQQQQQEFGAAPSLHEESHVVARNNSVPLSRRDCCDSTAKIWVRAFGDLRMLPLFFEATARWQKCRPSPLLLLLPTPSSPLERYLISKTRGQTNSPHWKTRILEEKLQEKRHCDLRNMLCNRLSVHRSQRLPAKNKPFPKAWASARVLPRVTRSTKSGGRTNKESAFGKNPIQNYKRRNFSTEIFIRKAEKVQGISTKKKSAHAKACENLFCWRECARRERERRLQRCCRREGAEGSPYG